MDADRLVEQVADGGLLTPGAPVVVLLSGGRDSVCLLDVVARIAPRHGGSVAVLHLNYGLRAEAAAEEAHCRALCARLGVELAVEVATRPDGAGNVQAWARAARYEAAEARARSLGPQALIAAGHTADDQVETILYRLAASPSRRALLGMRAREGRIVRPLLGLARAETTAYCERRGLAWCDDASNEGGRYARNRLRHGLLPALRALHPAAEANVLRVADVLREEAELLDVLVEQQLDPGPSLPLDRLQRMAPALRRLVVQRLADAAAGRPVPGAARRADAVAALRRGGTAWLDLGGGVRAVAEYGVLRAERTPAPGAPDAPPEPVALPVPGAVAFGRWQVRCDPSPVVAADGVLDRDALDAALRVRAWRPGDRIAPVGLGGTSSLQDLFGARRIPRARRAELPVVVCGEQVAWVPGLATAAAFGITARTRAAVRVSATEPSRGPAA